ncbi:MAG: ribonuclease E inhibitor RraB [Candidatus Acidiferrales bacterium]
MKNRAEIGDVAEIKTSKGLAYVQYTHNASVMGELVRVLPGLFSKRPDDFGDLAQKKELYFVFYPLSYAIRAGDTEIVSRQPVPKSALQPPLMRKGGEIDDTGKTLSWKIIPALSALTIEELTQSPTIRELTPEQEKLSIHLVRPHPMMVKELARGWTPECAEQLMTKDRAEAKIAKARQSESADASDQPMRHYLYFKEKSSAENVAEQLENQGFSVEVRPGADGDTWLALARHSAPNNQEEMERLRDKMETLAAEFNGEYDGWEIATVPNRAARTN